MLVRILMAGLATASRKRWRGLLNQPSVVVNSINRKSDLWHSLSQQDADLIIVNQALLASEFEKAVSGIRQLPDQPDLIVLTKKENSEERAQLLAAGCLAVLNDKLDDQYLQETLTTLIERRREQDLHRLRTARDMRQSRLSDFVSDSPAMLAFLKTVQRVVSADTPLLLYGETGVGKERLASAIHAESPRTQGPFIAVNCGALPEGLMESELFGHEEGAFTGASRSRRGHFELAHAGTIFLDEIGELPLHVQVKLLRVLQERTIQRVGSERTTQLDVRIIAATNRDLVAEIEAKRFRQDLYYRLAVVTLTIPPLRERKEDIPPLAQSYIEHFRGHLRLAASQIAPDAMQALIDYGWPGNVRELINVIERAMLLCGGERITLADLPDTISGPLQPSHRSAAATDSVFPGLAVDCFNQPWKVARQAAMDAFEKTYLSELLKSTNGRIGESAIRADIDPRSLYEKMKRHRIDKQEFRGT